MSACLVLLLQDLITDLKKELTGDFEDGVLGLMDPFPVYDARCLKKAMKVTKFTLKFDERHIHTPY